MKFKVGLILIALVFIGTAVNEVRKASIQADDKSSAIVEVASAATSQAPSNLTPLQGNYSSSESLHLEPLLLLLLGSTLFCISSAIRLVLSRKLGSKSIGVEAKKSQAALLETRRGGA